MVRQSGYSGVLDADQRFESMRTGMDRLRALELAQPVPSPAGEALTHAIGAIRSAANLMTQQLEFFELQRLGDQSAHACFVAELEALRPLVQDLRQMANSYHPASPECRTLSHAAAALRMAADVLSGRADFYGLVLRDGTTIAGGRT